jgi:hypothetical protein
MGHGTLPFSWDFHTLTFWVDCPNHHLSSHECWSNVVARVLRHLTLVVVVGAIAVAVALDVTVLLIAILVRVASCIA